MTAVSSVVFNGANHALPSAPVTTYPLALPAAAIAVLRSAYSASARLFASASFSVHAYTAPASLSVVSSPYFTTERPYAYALSLSVIYGPAAVRYPFSFVLDVPTTLPDLADEF